MEVARWLARVEPELYCSEQYVDTATEQLPS